MRAVLALAVAWGLGCASTRPAATATPRLAPAVLAARLADADQLAERGCYLCLKEAAAAYASLLETSADPAVARHALENDLMLALREIELRMPDSGARGHAEELQRRVASSYAAYFAALDALAAPVVTGGVTLQEIRQQRERRAAAAAELEKAWPASPMRAYFYLAMALNAGMVKELKPQLDAMLSTHAQDLSLSTGCRRFSPHFLKRPRAR